MEVPDAIDTRFDAAAPSPPGDDEQEKYGHSSWTDEHPAAAAPEAQLDTSQAQLDSANATVSQFRGEIDAQKSQIEANESKIRELNGRIADRKSVV